MSRHKKRSVDRTAGDSHDSPDDRASRTPDPPRPNVVFLTATVILLVVWITILVILAVTT